MCTSSLICSILSRYACKRGLQFEEDPALEMVVYECQDGTQQYTKRGFFNTPPEPDKWPRCLEGYKFSISTRIVFILLVF